MYANKKNDDASKYDHSFENIFLNKLEYLAAQGFDFNKPRWLLNSEFNTKETNHVRTALSLLFYDENPPKENWCFEHNKKLICVANNLITSILFTGVTLPKYEWLQCLVSHFLPEETLIAGIIKTYNLPHVSNIEEEQKKGTLKNINAQVCWMHHLSVYTFICCFS